MEKKDVAPHPVKQETKTDKAEQLLKMYKHNMETNGPRSIEELRLLEEVLGKTS